MSKKASAIVLTGLMVMNQVSDTSLIYASASTQPANSQEQAEKQSQQVIYLTNGEGSTTAGNGTKENPYQNIRTALEQVEDGGIIKLVGQVLYSKHETHPTNKSALPLTITKNITFEGENPYVDGICSRAPIQLAANVTFKNMRLEMVNLNQLMPGVQEPAPTPADEGIFKSGRTIYTAGYTLTIDNVNTRIGSNQDQIKDRPFISGGTYQNIGTIGPKSIVNIINANDETQFSSIYAGDYWLPRTHSFELTLDKKTNNKTILDRTIHTGNILHNYQGDVTVNLEGATTALTLDNTKHLGSVDVKITSSSAMDNLILNKVRTLTLAKDARLYVPSQPAFEVKNLSIQENALLDFTKLEKNPKISGTFTGSTDSTNTGSIYLYPHQTLEVEGVATGFVRLNAHDKVPNSHFLKQNHPYLKADANSTAQLIINPNKGQEHLKLTVQESVDNGRKSWSVLGDISQNMKDFKFLEGSTQLIDPETVVEYVFPIEYINEFDETYVPDDLDEFEFSLIKHADNDTIITPDDDDDLQVMVYPDYATGSVILSFIEYILDPDLANDGQTSPVVPPYEGDLTLKVVHKDTKKEITRTITVLRSDENGTVASLTGSVKLSGHVKAGETLNATPENLPSDAKDLKYQWFVDGVEISGATQETFELKPEYIGKKIKVEVRTSNYKGILSSSEEVVLTNELTGTVNIKGNLQVGETVTAVSNQLQTDVQGLKYKWYLDEVAIEGETNSTLQLKPEYARKKITVEISSDNYKGVLRSPAVTVTMKTLTGDLEVTGSPKVGQTLTATAKNLPSDSIQLNYQWLADGVEIPGETQSTLTLKPEHVGKNIKVVAGHPSYLGTITSSDISIVLDQLTGTVELVGKPVVGQTLTATLQNSPNDLINVKYQWFVDGVEMSGATQETFELKSEHIGKKIKVEVCADNYTGTLTSSEVVIQKLVNQAPTIQGLTDLTIRQGKTIDLTTGVTAIDGEGGDLTSKITFPTVDVTKLNVGRHELEYSVTDSNGVTTVMKRILIVESNQAPMIQGLDSLTLKMNEIDQFKSLDGVVVTDDHDQNLIPTVTGTISKPQAGQTLTSTLTYTVTDSDGNTTTLNRFITVTNHVPVLQANSVTIKANEAIDLLHDSRINLVATDHEDGNIIAKVQVKNSQGLDVSNPSEGAYPVTYTVMDSDGNTVEATIIINVQSNQAPLIQGATATTIKVGEVDRFDLLAGITVTDDYDQNLIPTVTGTILKPQAGQTLTSTLTYTVTDSDGNTTTLNRLITVTNYLPALQVQPIVIKANQAIDLLNDSRLHLEATDIEDGNLTSQVKIKDLGGLNPNQPVEGDYFITYSVTDSDGNTTEQTTTIKVQSNHAPILSGIENQQIQSGETFDPLAGVEAYDPEDGKLSNIQVNGMIDPYQIGEQTLTYTVTDSDGNITTATRIITVTYQTETPSDSAISETFVPQTQTQLDQLLQEIKEYDHQAAIVEIKEEEEYHLYKIKLQLLTKAYSQSTEYFIEIKVAKSIKPEVGLPGLTPENNDNNSGSQPDNDNNSGSQPDNDNNTGSQPDNDNNTGSQPDNDNNTGSQPDNDNNSGSQPDNDNNSGSQPDNDNNSEKQPEDSNNNKNEKTESVKPITGFSNFMGYLGGAVIALGGILSFKKKK